MATRVCTNYYRAAPPIGCGIVRRSPCSSRTKIDASAPVPLIPRRSIDGRQGDGTNSIIGWTEQRIQS
jgi:hypothetical protein